MLKLVDVKKDYLSGDDKVSALKGINLSFRQNEFASILGPSGCGKTTLLNIIGGLDRYTSGDLIISNRSTKSFKDSDWDNYRNKKIGFIFQNYNLIQHLDILQNVELALTISGITPKERKKRAEEALISVGLSDKLKKKPNQLSGGQMQRVSIARALVNNPDIILADEPTGALDSATSVQIMELLKEIAKTKLVIMVTHNGELAEKYSTRIIKLFDGNVIEDTNAYETDTQTSVIGNSIDGKKGKVKKEKSNMSFATAIKLSYKNLLTKKVRTIITSIAGSIGIIGVGLVLALSNGFNSYIYDLESGSLGSIPIVAAELSYELDIMQLMSMGMMMNDIPGMEAYPQGNSIVPKKTSASDDIIGSFMEMVKFNKLTSEYVDYIDNINRDLCSVQYTYPLDIHLITKDCDNNIYFPVSSDISFQQLLGDTEFLKIQYECLEGRFPETANEAVIILDKYNQVDVKTLKAIGVNPNSSLTFKDLLTSNLKVALNNGYYTYSDVFKTFREVPRVKGADDYPQIYNNNEVTKELNITGVIRIKPNIEFAMMLPGIGYTSALVDEIYDIESNSDIVKAQLKEENKTIDVTTGNKFSVSFDFSQIASMDLNEYLKMAGVFFYKDDADYMLNSKLKELGGLKQPSAIYLYPKSYNDKVPIKEYLDVYNQNVESDADVVHYMDMTETATGMVSSVIDVVSIILVCFAAISLVVSSIMISIVTYVSVIERINEIGILRSIGARKLDICNVFNAETTITGLVSGTLGVAITYLLSIPINLILRYVLGMDVSLAALKPLNGGLLIIISIVLSFFAGLVPAIIAARKDPVEALRTE